MIQSVPPQKCTFAKNSGSATLDIHGPSLVGVKDLRRERENYGGLKERGVETDRINRNSRCASIAMLLELGNESYYVEKKDGKDVVTRVLQPLTNVF